MFSIFISLFNKTSHKLLSFYNKKSSHNFPLDFKVKLQHDLELALGKRAMTAEDIQLDPEYSYFLLHASFGDKWCILSFLHEFLTLQKTSKIIASENDRELVRIFLGEKILSNSIVFMRDDLIGFISSYITPLSLSSMYILQDSTLFAQTNNLIIRGFPKNIVRHLHLVKYPYFNDLHLIHGLSYATCVRMILGLPSETLPSLPKFYIEQDLSDAKKLIFDVKDMNVKYAVLFNVYNISHIGLTDNQILSIIKIFENNNIQVILNVTGHPFPEKIQALLERSKMSTKVNIPGHLLALVCDNVDSVVGVVGGAMSVAVQFSFSHILSFYTQGRGYDFPLKKLFGGNYSDNIWRHYNADWPCLFDDRVVKFIDCSEAYALESEYLDPVVEEFIKDIGLTRNYS